MEAVALGDVDTVVEDEVMGFVIEIGKDVLGAGEILALLATTKLWFATAL